MAVQQRSGLPLFFLSAFVLAVSVGLVFLVFSPLADGLFPGAHDRPADSPTRSENDKTEEEPSTPAAPDEHEPEAPVGADAPPADTAPESPAAPRSIPQSTTAVDTHTVRRGDTLFALAGHYWADSYLWPVLFVHNSDSLPDPDLLRPGLRLVVGDRPDSVMEIREAHLAAYARYRDLGDAAVARGRNTNSAWWIQTGWRRINDAHWVLYSGLRYDPNLLGNAGEAVSERDRTIVLEFITRFGPAPGSR